MSHLVKKPPVDLVTAVLAAGRPLQGDSGGLGLGYVDSVPSQDNL